MITHKSTRLPEYDYTSPGFYFITLVTQHRRPLFGTIVNESFQPSSIGALVLQEWSRLPARFGFICLDEAALMPDHFHGLLQFNENGSQGTSHTGQNQGSPLSLRSAIPPGSLGAVVRAFKSSITYRYHLLKNTPGGPLWQPGYYERVIRSETDLAQIREYIRANQLRISQL